MKRECAKCGYQFRIGDNIVDDKKIYCNTCMAGLSSTKLFLIIFLSSLLFGGIGMFAVFGHIAYDDWTCGFPFVECNAYDTGGKVGCDGYCTGK